MYTMTLPSLMTACLAWGVITCTDASTLFLLVRRKKMCPACFSLSFTTLVYVSHSKSASADLKPLALSICARTFFNSSTGAAGLGARPAAGLAAAAGVGVGVAGVGVGAAS